MRGRRRKFYQEGYQHIFQHAIGYHIIFYSLEDRLVFYTIFSIMAWRYGVSVLALALMYNHFHTLINTASSKVMSLFIGTVTSTYALAFNRDSGRKGPLFEKAYGNSVKSSGKIIRTSISYSYNNSVEKQLFTRAEEDRWNFLAYIGNDHPFSEPVSLEKASKKLRSSLKVVKAYCADHYYLNYVTLRRLYRGLSPKEREQLTDYIISRYLPIDQDKLLSYYKSYDQMVMAINSNTGNEYVIREEYNSDSDTVYRKMLQLVASSTFAENPHTIVSAPIEKKYQIAKVLKLRTGAKDYQIRRFLHLNAWPTND